MGFGQWLRDKRQEKGWSINALAKQANLNPSTVSRIENETISPTVDTVIHLVKSLEINEAEFYRVVADNPDFEIPKLDQTQEVIKNVLTMQDVISFDEFFHRNEAVGRELLCLWFNRIYKKTIRRPKAEHPKELFHPEDIDKFLSDTWSFSVELLYPATISVQTIRDIYWQGGVIIPEDAFTFVNVRVQTHEEKHYNTQLFPLSVWNLLRHGGMASKAKLADFQRLDQMFDSRGEIAVICVKAIEFENVFIPKKVDSESFFVEHITNWRNVTNYKMGYMLIFVHRWFSHLNILEEDWLPNLRRQFFAGSE